MGTLLFDEQPLVIQPSLAKLIGLNEAIFLQQVHYWLQKSTHFHDGRRWVYNTYQGWQEQFPFWGINTIRRIIEKLEQMGAIRTGNFNQSKIDKTKWYTIEYGVLEALLTSQNGQTDCENSQSTAQIGQMDSPEWADELPNLGRPIPEITPEKKDDDEDNARVKKPNPFVFFEQNIGVLAPVVAEEIGIWIDGSYFDEPEAIVIEAISLAVKNGARKWSYANKILIDWADHHLRTLQQVKAYSREFEGRGKHEKGSSKPRRADPNVRKPSITGGKVGWVGKDDQDL